MQKLAGRDGGVTKEVGWSLTCEGCCYCSNKRRLWAICACARGGTRSAPWLKQNASVKVDADSLAESYCHSTVLNDRLHPAISHPQYLACLLRRDGVPKDCASA